MWQINTLYSKTARPMNNQVYSNCSLTWLRLSKARAILWGTDAFHFLSLEWSLLHHWVTSVIEIYSEALICMRWHQNVPLFCPKFLAICQEHFHNASEAMSQCPLARSTWFHKVPTNNAFPGRKYAHLRHIKL